MEYVCIYGVCLLTEQVVIEKSRPKNIHTQSIPSGCIVESEDEEETTAATSLNSESI